MGIVVIFTVSIHCHESLQMSEVGKCLGEGKNFLEKVPYELGSDGCSPSRDIEYSGLISFRIDWFDLLAVQRTLKSLLQYHSTKASILQHSAFFMVQLSHLHMTTGKTIALSIHKIW